MLHIEPRLPFMAGDTSVESSPVILMELADVAEVAGDLKIGELLERSCDNFLLAGVEVCSSGDESG